jgi:nitrile hydratase
MSYYERWLTALLARLVQSGLATRAEIERGTAEPGAQRSVPAVTAASARSTLLQTPRTELAIPVQPRFRTGQRVRGANLNTPTHTRMPRYTRGKVGTVERDRGVFALPDNEVYFLEPKAQHVYLVRFTARELWGNSASANDTLHIDLWDDYLEPA